MVPAAEGDLADPPPERAVGEALAAAAAVVLGQAALPEVDQLPHRPDVVEPAQHPVQQGAAAAPEAADEQDGAHRAPVPRGPAARRPARRPGARTRARRRPWPGPRGRPGRRPARRPPGPAAGAGRPRSRPGGSRRRRRPGGARRRPGGRRRARPAGAGGGRRSGRRPCAGPPGWSRARRGRRPRPRSPWPPGGRRTRGRPATRAASGGRGRGAGLHQAAQPAGVAVQPGPGPADQAVEGVVVGADGDQQQRRRSGTVTAGSR